MRRTYRRSIVVTDTSGRNFARQKYYAYLEVRRCADFQATEVASFRAFELSRLV